MKKRIAILFGGRSAEHEVSVLSSKNIAEALDKNLFELIVIGISKEGTWYQFPDASVLSQIKSLSDLKLPKDADPIALVCIKGKAHIFSLESKKSSSLDLAFPVLHGTFGEDGCVQGHFKMMNLPFVGCGVLGSAMGMDKEVMKRLLDQAKIPNAKYRTLHKHRPHSFDELSKELGLPFFIKPANAGSSVGVHKVKSKAEFEAQLKDAFSYDQKVLAEEFIKGREIEISVMGLNHQAKASVAGEIIPTHDFYSYDAKYLDENGAKLTIPAPISNQELSALQKMACQAFEILCSDGMARVDFFLTDKGQPYLNEINTIPGFTKISMYPKMWEASGIGYTQLITQLIQLGFDKFKAENDLLTNYDKLGT
jgi:D-alanine-D-alanine ligase